MNSLVALGSTLTARSTFPTTPAGGRDRPGYPCRLDAVWVSPDLDVSSIDYDYRGAVEAGSDPALVTAELVPAAPASPEALTRFRPCALAS